MINWITLHYPEAKNHMPGTTVTHPTYWTSCRFNKIVQPGLLFKESVKRILTIGLFPRQHKGWFFVRLQASRFACTLDLSFMSWVTKVSVPINIIIITMLDCFEFEADRAGNQTHGGLSTFQRLWCSRLFLSIAPSLDSHAISAHRTLSFIMLLTSWRVLPTCGLPLRCRSAWITRMSSKSSKVTHSVVPDSKPFKLAVVVIDNSSEGVLTCRGCLTASLLHRKVFSNFPTYEALIWVSTSHLGF